MARKTHTPAPWTLEHNFAGGIAVSSPHRRLTVAHVAKYAESIDEDTANATLIAAAPDMLAALKAFAEPGQPVSAHVIEMARDAIAKAEARA